MESGETHKFRRFFPKRNGEVSERFKVHAWNACMGDSPSRVRIPPSPPFPVIFSFPVKYDLISCNFLLRNVCYLRINFRVLCNMELGGSNG